MTKTAPAAHAPSTHTDASDSLSLELRIGMNAVVTAWACSLAQTQQRKPVCRDKERMETRKREQ